MSNNSSSNLWLFLEVIARRRGLIFGLVFFATIVSVIISLLLPKWYIASALFLPPPDEQPALGIANLGEVELYTGGRYYPGLVTPNDVYARMLRSRRIADQLIEQYDLSNRYHTANKTATYKALAKHTKVIVTEEGMLSLSFEDRDPAMAASIATTYVEKLITLNSELRQTTATTRREFIEERLGEVVLQLDTARKSLEKFQLENRAVNFDEQTRLAIDQAVGLKVSRANLELDIQVTEKMLGVDNPILLDKRQRLSIINGQLDKLEWGGDESDSSFFSLPVAEIPKLKGEYSILYGRVQVNQRLYETLLELLEHARIQEEEKTPKIAVLDWPKIPDIRTRPQRSLIVIATFCISLLGSLFLAAFLEYLRRMNEKHPEDYARLMFFLSAFMGWLPGVKKRPMKNDKSL